MGTRHFATREKVVKSLKELRIKVVCSGKGEDPSYEGIKRRLHGGAVSAVGAQTEGWGRLVK